LGGKQILGRARRRVPEVALHRAALVAHHGAIDAVPRAAIAAREAVGIAVDELGFAGGYRRAVTVRDAPVDGERRRLRGLAERDRLVDADAPRVIQIERTDRASELLFSREPRRIGKP